MTTTDAWCGPLPDRQGMTLLRAALDEDVERAAATLTRWWRTHDVRRVPGTLLEVAAAAGERVGDPPQVAAALRSWRRWSTARSLVAEDLARRLDGRARAQGLAIIARGDLATRAVAAGAAWRWDVRAVEVALAAGDPPEVRARIDVIRAELLRLAHGVGSGPPIPVRIAIARTAKELDAGPAAHLRRLVRRNWAHRPPAGLRWLLDAGATLAVLHDGADPEVVARLLLGAGPLPRWERTALTATLGTLRTASGMRRIRDVERAIATGPVRVAAGLRRSVLSATAAPPLSLLRRGAPR